MAGDAYDALGLGIGLTPDQLLRWRQKVGAPPVAAPMPAARPSYEGATLQDFMPKPLEPFGPPLPPRPSYEGANLANMAPSTPGVSLASPAATPPAGKMTMRPQTADNLSTAPAQLSPSAMKQVEQVANASNATQKNVAKGLEADANKKNLEGATFADSDGQSPPIDGSIQGKPQLIDAGGRRPASWQIQEGMDLGENADLAHTSADERGRVAAAADYTAGQKAAEFEQGYLQRYNKAAENYALQESSRAEQFQRDYDDHMGKLDELRGQIREAKVNPFGGVPSGIARLTNAVAIGLGAFASKHGENAGLEAVKHTIDTNLREQESELAKLERGAKGEAGFLGILKQQFGDIGQAKAAAHIAYIEAAKTELAKQIGSPEVADPRLLAAYERLNARLDDELVQKEIQFRGVTRDRVVRHDINAQPKYAGGAVTAEAKHDARYLSESYEKAGIPAALSQLKDIDRTIDAMGDGDIPGVGMVEGLVPNKLAPDRWVAGRQTVQAVKNSIGHSIFGGALSPTEAAKLNEQLDGAKDAASLRRTVQAYRQALQQRAANVAAGASPEGVTLYEQRGGSVQRGSPGSQRQVAVDKPAAPYVKEPK